jgi:hypothetical protein
MSERNSKKTEKVACVPGAVEQANNENLRPSVSLTVREQDRTVLTGYVDRTASQNRIIANLREELRKFSVPYRDVDQRILEAIRVKLTENITYEAASIWVFGDANFARQIRYWQNKWQLQ